MQPLLTELGDLITQDLYMSNGIETMDKTEAELDNPVGLHQHHPPVFHSLYEMMSHPSRQYVHL